jgi:uncharacterized LabA/DUF88 family protein
MDRICVFVDGENFRHSIVELFWRDFNDADYLPKQAEWTEFFDWIAEQCSHSPQRIRTYWYAIRDLAFFPYRLNQLLREPEKLRSVLSQSPSYRTELDEIADEPSRNKRMTEIVARLQEQQERMQARFNGWTTVQEGISGRHNAIEFRKAGTITCNLLENNRLGREKAVDVKLASDLIALKDIYDIAVIVSGDQDYVPAVQVVKDYGKRVVTVAFERRDGRLLPGGARQLNQASDWGLIIKHSDLDSFLKILPRSAEG